MHARKLTPSERVAADFIRSIAYFQPFDANAQAAPAPEAQASRSAFDAWGAFDSEGRITGTAINHNFSTYYDGHIVLSGGIGGVASLPEYRTQGGVRQIMRAILEEDRKNGVLFSALFPFSHSFYRRFGYELCHEGRILRFPMQALQKFKQTDTPRMHTEAEGDAPFRPVYEAYASGFSYALARGDAEWARVLRRTPQEAKAYRYILSRDGRDVSYCMIHTTRVADDALMLWVDEWAYVDKAALYGLLGFLYGFSAQCKTVRMEAPDGFELAALLDEPYDIEQAGFVRSMARVLDVETALRLMRHPQQPGTYTLCVADDFLPENAGLYCVSFGAGEPRVSRAKGLTPDASMTVQTLAQLCFGYFSFDMAALKPDVEIAQNADTLRRVFVRKPRFLADRY